MLGGSCSSQRWQALPLVAMGPGWLKAVAVPGCYWPFRGAPAVDPRPPTLPSTRPVLPSERTVLPVPVAPVVRQRTVVPTARVTVPAPVTSRRLEGNVAPIYPRAVGTTGNCAAYRTPIAAQRAFIAEGGPERDRLGLDPDGDGYACSYRPAAAPPVQ